MTRLCLVALVFINLASADPRTWTDKSGREVEGEVLEITQSHVQFKRTSDGQVFRMLTDNFSSADQQLLAEMRTAQVEVSATTTEPEFFDGLDWPRRTRLPDNYDIEVVKEDNSEKIYIYRTPHFEFHSDVKLARKVVRDFGKIFEGTYSAMQAFPLEWKPEPQDGHYVTRLFETKESYLEGGGVPNSAGQYNSETREIWAPLTSLGVEKSSSSYTLDDSENHSTLIHEITHQVHHDWLRKLPPWMVEGMAVYMESVPYDDGEFRYDKVDVAAFLSGPWGGDTVMAPVETLMTISQHAWIAKFSMDPDAVPEYYRSAFILLYYFLHLDGEGEGRLLYAYCRALEAGQSDQSARKILLDGRDYAELIEAIKRAYQREDVKIVTY